jgi:subtilisin family serine protease
VQAKRNILVFSIIVIVWSIALGGLAASAVESDAPAINVPEDVLQEVSNSGEANVIVTLKEFSVPELQSSSARTELKETQTDLISDSDVNTSETKTFTHLPIISTTVDESQLDELANDDRVASVRLRRYYTPGEFTTSSFAGVNKPALDSVIPLVEADDAWNNGTPYTGAGERIVIIDTGVDSDHAFINGAVVQQLCYAQGPNGIGGSGNCPNGSDTQSGNGSAEPCTTNTSCGHGTHVAGIAAGRNSVGGAPIGGVAPDASIVAIQVFGTYTGGICGDEPEDSPCILAEDTDVLSALQWVVANSTNVASINLSLGGGAFSSTCDYLDPTTANTITQLRNTFKIATVIASGNSGSGTNISWPACFSSAIPIGSSGTFQSVNAVSTFTDSNSLIALWAPGYAVRSSVPVSMDTDGNADGYGAKSGTSMATPVIAGAFALLREAYPSETVTQLLTRLQQNGTSITDSRNNVTRTRPSVYDAIVASEPSAPTAPSSVTLTAQPGYGAITWTASSGATSYRVYNGSGALLKTVAVSPRSTTYATTAGVSQRFGIAAVNGMGVSTIRYSNYITGAIDPSDEGYAFFASNGAVVGKGTFAGYTRGGLSLNRPVVGGATSAQLNGGWSVAADGGIFTFGSAQFYGSTGSIKLNKPIVGMASTPSGRGYWLVASDGGIFSFGDAQFKGSTGAIKLNRPIVGMASTPSGRGYWLVASDGGIFSFGDAQFKGSTGAISLNQPIVGMASTPSGRGYWLVASDGGIFSFGDAQFKGSTGSIKLNQPIVGMKPNQAGSGYWLFASDGGVFSFGSAAFLGSGVGFGYSYPRAG